ncbi:MAG TPA: hypothetical protein PK890_07905, partial [Terrimesophilobacter sp.]|nr:hypothetical protein [Terrimesophilobacter sp.]
MRRRTTLERPTTYQELVTEVRRYDRDQLLLALANYSRIWDGSHTLPEGRTNPFLPWNVAGAAATALTRGTSGGRAPDADDVAWACYLYFNLEHPGDTADPGFAVRLLARILAQQAPYQRASMLELARPVALFEQTAFKPDYQPRVMTPGWGERVLGCSVSEWVSVGFALYAAMKNGSHYPFDWEPGLDTLLGVLGGRARFEEVVERGFTTDVASFKAERRALVDAHPGTDYARYQREPYAFNPL